MGAHSTAACVICAFAERYRNAIDADTAATIIVIVDLSEQSGAKVHANRVSDGDDIK